MLKHLVLEYAASGTHIGGLRIIEIILLARNNELAARLYATKTNSLPSLPSTRAPLAPQQRHGKHGPRTTKFSNLPETWSLRNRPKQTKNRHSNEHEDKQPTLPSPKPQPCNGKHSTLPPNNSQPHSLGSALQAWQQSQVPAAGLTACESGFVQARGHALRLRWKHRRLRSHPWKLLRQKAIFCGLRK